MRGNTGLSKDILSLPNGARLFWSLLSLYGSGAYRIQRFALLIS